MRICGAFRYTGLRTSLSGSPRNFLMAAGVHAGVPVVEGAGTHQFTLGQRRGAGSGRGVERSE
ncbi:hypothetical protein BMF89_00040 [Arthrobacter sp. SRS-W-1-2016]|nr:hypothetical protein BMF89_00040 [Arthrobacter sp. SRS-W-1-2016]